MTKIIPQDLLEEFSSDIQEKLGCISKEEFTAKCKQLSRLEKQINILEFEIEKIKQNNNQ